MAYKICEWDDTIKAQIDRDATPQEAAEIDARRAAMPTVSEYTVAVQDHLDAEAQARNYDDIVSACSYAGAPNPFQAEGTAFVAWRGACWAACYAIMDEVEAGTRAQPTIGGLVALLPEFQP